MTNLLQRARPLLVGQAPGPRSDPKEPLSGRCGARLAGLCCIEVEEFFRRFECVNLIDKFPGKAGKGDRFPVNLARRAALCVSKEFADRKVVLLGDNVARAFEVGRIYPPGAFIPMWGGAVCTFPHPSGVSRWWNEPRNVREARHFWSGLALEAARAMAFAR
jgi:hypothetical protein